MKAAPSSSSPCDDRGGLYRREKSEFSRWKRLFAVPRSSSHYSSISIITISIGRAVITIKCSQRRRHVMLLMTTFRWRQTPAITAE